MLLYILVESVVSAFNAAIIELFGNICSVS